MMTKKILILIAGMAAAGYFIHTGAKIRRGKKHFLSRPVVVD